MANDLQIRDQSLMLQVRIDHDRVVAHQRASVRKHAQHGQKTDDPAQSHLTPQ